MNQSLLYIIGGVVALGIFGVLFYQRFIKKNGKRKINTPVKVESHLQLVNILKKVEEKIKIESNGNPKENVSLDGTINALVVDIKKRMFRPMHVDLFPDKDYGRQWDYLNYTGVYYLARKEDKSLEVITPPEILEDSPTELYEAVQTAEDMQEVFGWRNTEGNKSKLFLIVIASCVALFIMFMAMTYKKPTAFMLPIFFLQNKWVNKFHSWLDKKAGS